MDTEQLAPNKRQRIGSVGEDHRSGGDGDGGNKPKSFVRNVPSLSKLCLDALSAKPEAITAAALARAHRVLPPTHEQSVRAKQALLSALEGAGQLQDECIPPGFFDASMTSLCLANAPVSDALLARLARECPQLTALDLGGCFEVWGEGVEALLRACPKLRELRLENCRKLTAAPLGAMVRHGTALRSISLGGAVNVAPGKVRELVLEHSHAQQFEALHVSGLGLGGEDVSAIAQRCGALRALSLGFSHALADAHVAGLVARLPRLAELRLHWCHGLTDGVLRELATLAKALTQLDVSGCKALSADALTALCIGECRVPTLRRLDCAFTALTKESVAAIVIHAPQLNVVV
eukprot:g5549.t1